MESFKENEKIWLKALKRGDKKAYTYIYEGYYNKLCAYLYSLSDNGKLSEDIVQDVMLKLWVKRRKVNIHTSLNAFLYRAVHNAYMDRCRKNVRRRILIEELWLEAVMEVENSNKNLKERHLIALQKIINALPQKRREIFILSKLKNYKYREIAKIQGISERTVEGQIRKAMITVRSEFEKLRSSKLISILFYWGLFCITNFF